MASKFEFQDFTQEELDAKLQRYARLLVRKGCALREGQPLFVRASTDSKDFARLVAQEAYAAGCKRVTVLWSDEKIGRMTYDHCPVEEFETTPEWSALLHNSMAEQGASVLTLEGSDPEGFKGIDPAKVMANIIATHKACKPFYDHLDFGKTIWCIAGAATPAWAAKVFPDDAPDVALRRLWAAILHTARADGDDPEAAWDAHNASFNRRKEIMNGHRFDKLHYTNSLGTDLTVGMTKGHIWHGGADVTVDGRTFFPNMPTEEIYTSPDNRRVDGIIYSALPLINQGNIIDRFWIRFEKGEVVDYGAEVGYEFLKGIIETDEGSKRLGETALVPFSSPINQTGILFYSTLYDENAVCHVALGKGFPDCLEGGREMDDAQLREAGLNTSATHVDFMIGTDDLSIVGTTESGEEIEIFESGQWAF